MGPRSDEYLLMHKDIWVCRMFVSDDGAISGVRRNEAEAEHFPLGGRMNDMKFHEWWKDRAIPKSRHGSKTALQRLGYETTGSALVDNLALSLNDCYWIRPIDKEISWADVSLFTNEFVDSFGEITLDEHYPIDIRNKTRFNFATSQGELQKKWCIGSDGRRYMVKGNYGSSYQQSLNELFATSIHKAQGFDNYTTYYPVKLKTTEGGEGLGCLSYDFCSEEIESISAWEVLQTRKFKQNESLYYPLKEACVELGIKEEDFTRFMDYEIMTDYLISNTDRHMNNIAIMRNPDTLEILGLAPIYDSGNSMFYKSTIEDLSKMRIDKVITCSFVERESRLLRYVQDRSVVDVDKADLSFDVFYLDTAERHGRIPILRDLYHKKWSR